MDEAFPVPKGNPEPFRNVRSSSIALKARLPRIGLSGARILRFVAVMDFTRKRRWNAVV
jgi:hypothetical protein